VSKLQAPNPVPPLTSVPTSILARAAPQIFHGRDDFVGDIVQTILHSDQARVPILGPGGMGKTSVALTVANDLSIVKRFGDRRHFVPCEEVTNPAPLVELIALHLGISLPSSSPWQHLLDSLRSIHSHCLLILDNFETPWDPHKTRTQTEQMVADLSCMPLLSLVVTMRGRVPPAGVKWSHPSSPLHPLSVGAAKATFLDIWSLEDLKLDELLQALDFFPLAITLVASVGQSSQLSPSELLESWKKEQTKLLNLGPTDRLNSVDYSINLSLQSTAMQQTPDALQLLSIIAMPPGGVVLRTLPSLAPNIANLDHAIRTLLSVSLAYKETSGTLRLLSPIRSYISQHHIPDSISLESLRKFYFNLANQCECDPGHKDFLGIRDEVALEESNIESVLLHFLSEHGDEAAVLAVAHYSWYLYWHHPRSEALGAAINVARQRRFTELLPQCLRRLGNILYVVNDYIRAIAAFEEAQTLCRLRRNRLEAAYCLESLGNILRMQSRDEEACAKLEEARDEFEAIGNQLGAAQCLQSLGKTLRMQERYGEARTALEDALERFQEIGHPLGAAECLRSIGRLHYSEHQYDDARTIIEDARTQFQAIGSTLGATQCLQYLGEILLEQGRYGEAHISLENAREQYQVIGERLGAAQCLKGVGDILRRETRYNEAHSCLEEAQYQFRAIGDRLGIANSVRCIGEIFIALDRHVEARKALDDARGIYQEVGQLRRAKFCDQLLSSICDRSP
jgi:tetratricopeptide (TPR) repeat protein